MTAADHPALKLFSDLLAVPAPSGREERVAEIVRAKLDGLGCRHETDGAGNVTVRLDGRMREARPLVFAAHLDEIGMVVTGIEPDGSLPTTAADMALLLEALARRQVVGEAASEEMLRLLLSESIDDRLPALLPDEALVAHKTGNWDEATHDAGIVF